MDEIKEKVNDIEGHFAQKEIEEAKKLGIVIGYHDGSIKPDNCMTRAEGIIMMLNIYKILKK